MEREPTGREALERWLRSYDALERAQIEEKAAASRRVQAEDALRVATIACRNVGSIKHGAHLVRADTAVVVASAGTHPFISLTKLPLTVPTAPPHDPRCCYCLTCRPLLLEEDVPHAQNT